MFFIYLYFFSRLFIKQLKLMIIDLVIKLVNNIFLIVIGLGINLEWIWCKSNEKIKNWLMGKSYTEDLKLIKTTKYEDDTYRNDMLKIIPRSVNYHFTRQCNYTCGFCFHTAKTSYVLPLEVAKRGMKMLKEAGMEKINFSGGEPFIKEKGNYLGELVKFGKEELQLPSVTIVSNGSLIRESWFKEYGAYLDIIAISCDSFNEETNKKIGRGQGSRNDHIKKLIKIHEWCNKYNVLFKINTVVNMYNLNEDMSENIALLKPVRWKVFQCLLLEGENIGKEALRNAEPFYISDDQFKIFLDRHSHVECLVPECNTKMKDSYLILDEYMRFLNCQQGSKHPSPSILDVGVDMALSQSGFDENMFLKRGGIYKWSKPKNVYDCFLGVFLDWLVKLSDSIPSLATSLFS